MQTAVEWLESQFANIDENRRKVFDKAKEMEKQQIIDAHRSAYGKDGKTPNMIALGKIFDKQAEQYYNETYGSKGISLQNQSKSKVITEISDCINCDEAKPTHNICMDCVIKIGKQNQTEISDEEIEKVAKEYVLYNDQKRAWVIEGMKLYREQLKNKL